LHAHVGQTGGCVLLCEPCLMRWRNRLPPEFKYAELVHQLPYQWIMLGTEADDMGPTEALQIPRRESCDHTADMIPRSMNVNPPTVS